MADDQFQQSVNLIERWAGLTLGSGRTLSAELSLGDVSLWDIVAPFLALYRLPPLVAPHGRQLPWRQRFKQSLWPYRGLVGRFRDSVIYHTKRDASGCSQWPDNRGTVLFLGFSPLFYRDVLQPVATLLVTQGDLQVVVICNRTSPGSDTDANGHIIFQSVWSHWDGRVESRAKEMAGRLRLAKKTLCLSPQLAGTVQKDGGGLTWPAVRREFTWLFWREFRRLAPQIAVAEHILESHRPAFIVSADDADQRCRVYSLLGRHRGIPSLIVQQGFTIQQYPDWHFFSADAAAVMSQIQSDILIAQGVPSHRITITGHPGFDQLIPQSPGMADRVRSTLGLTHEQSMVLFASQPYIVGTFATADVRRSMIKSVCQAAEAVGHSCLVVKPHPNDDVHELQRLISRRRRVVLLGKDADTSTLIKACDVLITFFSQVALQSLIVGKPVINVAFPGSGVPTLYADSGATWVARSRGEIEAHLRALTGENRAAEVLKREAARQRFIYEWAYLPDGRATERVVALISNMLDTSRALISKHKNPH